MAFFVAIFAADGDYSAGELFIGLGLLWMALGFVTRWLPVLGRLGRAVDHEPGGMARFQDARGRVQAIGGTSCLLGAVAGMVAGWIL